MVTTMSKSKYKNKTNELSLKIKSQKSTLINQYYHKDQNDLLQTSQPHKLCYH